jgi:hypothetical protein
VRALLFLVALAMAAAPALAQEGNASTNESAGGSGAAGGDAPAAPQAVSFTLVPLNAGGDWVWALEGQSRPNPPLVVPPGAQVTLVLKQTEASAGTPHNLQVSTAPPQKTPNVADPGETQTITFTAPSGAGTMSYVCLIHAASMKGIIQIRTAEAQGGGSGAWEQFDGPTVPLGQVDPGAPAECAANPVPAVLESHVIGAPVPSDYVLRCTNPDAATAAPARPAHPADWVIPLSWGLIGLGVVGVVWVHKFYKP